LGISGLVIAKKQILGDIQQDLDTTPPDEIESLLFKEKHFFFLRCSKKKEHF